MHPLAKTGRPPQRAPKDVKHVAMSFRVSPAMKNLLLDLADANGVSMVEQLEMLLLREAELTRIEDYDG